MKIKQFRHLWNGQDWKNSSQSFPRPPRIIGQKIRQSNGRTTQSNCLFFLLLLREPVWC